MLRFSFLPSDYHPQILMLGEAEDFRQLAALLRMIAAGGPETHLEATTFAAPSDTSILVTCGDEPRGAQRIGSAGKSFAWMLSPDLARAFADQADALTDPRRKAGSEILECGATGEIPVKLSLGEFTDRFLLPRGT